MDGNRDVMGILKKLFWNTRSLLHKLLTGCYNTLRVHPFCHCIVYGSLGVLIDADHLISRPLSMGRPFHIPLFIAIWVVFIVYVTYCSRRFHGVSVKEVENVNLYCQK